MSDSTKEREKKLSLREGASILRQTVAVVLRASPRGAAILAVLTLATAGCPLVIAWAGKEIVDGVVARSREATLRWVLVELGAVTLQLAVSRAHSLVARLTGDKIARDVNVAIIEKALALELEHFEDGEFYDRLTRARRSSSYSTLSVITTALHAIQGALTLVGYIAVIASWSGWAVLVLLAAALPASFFELRFSQKLFKVHNWRAPFVRQLNYLEWLLSNVSHVKEVKLFGIGPLMLGRYKDLAQRFYDEDRRLATKRAAIALVLSLVATGTFYGCYASVALAAAAGTITLGSMTLYLVAFRQGQQAFETILESLSSVYDSVLNISNLFEYLAFTPARVVVPEAPPLVEEGIRFEDVGFRYPKSDKWAVRHLSFFVPRGQSVALVGENGAGKTTIVKLLTRLYEPTEGRVLLDGKDLRAWDREALRARFAVVFQDFSEYELALHENVGVGDVARLADRSRIERALKSGGADQVVATLEKGLETRLGKWAHDGVELSGGQWQKIALARAFMREEADILVLDEPTASLDARAEHEVFQRFQTLTKGRTSFLISHRFSTVRMADRIVVLEKGAIQEDGSHEELVARGGRYASLFELQAGAYR